MKDVCLVSQLCRNVHDQCKMSYKIWEVHNFSRKFSKEKDFTTCIFCCPKGILNASEYYFLPVWDRNCDAKSWSILCFKFLWVFWRFLPLSTEIFLLFLFPRNQYLSLFWTFIGFFPSKIGLAYLSFRMIFP